jgi:voltage-gated potassium channel
MTSPALGRPAAESVGPFQFVILVLSLLTMGAIAADTFLSLPREVSRILQGIDFIACAVFFVDFVIRFRAAKSKLRFMKWGWIDLAASIPSIDALRAGRFVSVVRVLRLLRGIRSIPRLLAVLFVSRIGILLCETAPQSNIRTAGDAVWWSMTTVTTVGYGDRYPVTAAGRVVAIALMIGGMGLFGTLSGIIASVFLGHGKEDSDSELLVEMKAMRAELEQLRREKD